MSEAALPINPGPRTRGALAIELLFLAFVPGACLVLTDFMDVNAPKWFLIRTVPPLLLALEWWRCARRGERLFRSAGPLGAVALAFALWHVPSVATALNAGRAWVEVSELAGLLCAFLLAARLSISPASRDRILWMLTLMGAAVSVYGIAQHFGYDFMSWQESTEVPVSRGTSFFAHATFTASVLIQIIPIAVALAALSKGWPARVGAGAAAVLMLYHLSFTGARMATLSLVITAIACSVWIGARSLRAGDRVHLQWRSVAAITAIALIVLAAGGWFVMRAWQAKNSDLFAIRQASFALRLIHWETSSRIVMAHPVLGVGAGNYEVVSPSYWNEVERLRTARFGRWMQQAHNEYLQTAAELGLPGVALLIALFAYGVVSALDIAARAGRPRERAIGLALAASVAAIALDANITFSLQAPGSVLVFWAILGVIAGSFARFRSGPARAGSQSREAANASETASRA